jgi:CheY-like chemotaxis protein
MNSVEDRPYRILVVDDSKISRKVVVTELEKLNNIELSIHSDPLDALEAIEDFSPDLIVSDFEMPNLSGLELCGKVRSHKDFNKTPFLIISGSIDVGFNAKALEAGVNQSISKGFKSNEVKKIAEKYMREVVGGGDMAILIVDDSNFNRKLMTRMVENLNARVFHAEDADRGDEILEEHSIDLILLDHEMPGRKGVDYCRELKTDPK